MHPAEHKKLTHYSPLIVMSVFGLMVGLFITVIGAQQQQDNRSKAAIVTGNYNGNLTTNGNIINGSVYGDVIGSSNTIAGNVSGCVKGSGNIIGGRVTGTVSGTGNIVALGSGGGPCLSNSPTAVPTQVPTATSAPTATNAPTPTKTPTPTPSKTPTPSPSMKPTTTPKPSTGVTLVPSVTSNPSVTLTPTATPEPGSTQIAINVLLHGLGKGGDAANPNTTGNTNPKRPQRFVTVEIYNATNQLILTKQVNVHYSPTEGSFVGTLNLGNAFVSGAYTVKIKEDQFLRGVVPGIQNIIAGQTTTLANVTLVAGDVDNNNQVNIVDYNLVLGCYSDLLPAQNCTGNYNVLTDLNDDGNVNQFDYNLFIRELTNIGGQ